MNRKKDDYRRAEGYARKLIEAGDRPEDQIRDDLSALLKELSIESLLSYPTDRGPADLYLPRRRTFIETKRLGLAQNFDNPQPGRSETPLEQLERYLQAEVDRELGMPDLYRSDEQRHRAWTGILTDGDVWSIWKYPHKTHATAERDQVCENHRFSSAGELVDKLQKLLPDNQRIGKPWIPEQPNRLFASYFPEIQHLHDGIDYRQEPGVETKFRLWLDMLKVSGMAPDTDVARYKMFVEHSFLVCIARGVIHTVAHPYEPPDAGKILAEGFVAWLGKTIRGKQLAQRLLNEVHGYEWRLRRGDVLRSIYQEFIAKDDRKLFGEYYTPNWLAKMLVDIVCDDAWCEQAIKSSLNGKVSGVGVLDPSCGSGTFLYHAVVKLLNSKALQSTSAAPRKAEIVTRLVHGLDVHPVAVEIARATLLRALPAPPPDELDGIHIYQGDSLMANEDEGLFSFDQKKDEFHIRTPKGTILVLPETFMRSADFIRDMRQLGNSALRDEETLPDNLLREGFSTDAGKLLKAAHQDLRSIIDSEGDSVWAWYVINRAGPFLLSHDKVDRIVANPPWVRMSEIQVEERKETLQNLAGKPTSSGKSASTLSLDLWGGGENATAFDIAQLFVRRCRELYLAEPRSNPAAWLLNAATIRASNWKKFRDWHKAHLRQIIDFSQLREPPFSGAKSCALLEHCRHPDEDAQHLLVVNKKGGNKIKAQTDPEKFRALIELKVAPERIPTASSGYLNDDNKPLFRNGAIFFPQVLIRVERCMINNGRAELQTLRPGPRSKRPWKLLEAFDGDVPASWVRSALFSEDVFPFHVTSCPSRVLVPTHDDGRLLREAEFQEGFWRKLDQAYREHCGKGSNTPKTLIDQIDYQKKLSAQLLSQTTKQGKSTVLYPNSGQRMRAARIDRQTELIDNTLFWWEAPSELESLYLLSILNAPALSKAFAEGRNSDRHFTVTPWLHVPIPRFDPCNEDHIRLSKLAETAELACCEWADQNRQKIISSGQISISKSSRELPVVVAVLGEIDEVIRKLMPEQATDRSDPDIC